EHLTSKTDNQIDGTISSSHSSGNSDSDTSAPASSKPKTGQSKLKVKTKRKVQTGSKTSTIKVKGQRSASDINSSEGKVTKNPSLARKVLDSLLSWRSRSKPQVSAKAPKSLPIVPSKSSSDSDSSGQQSSSVKSKEKIGKSNAPTSKTSQLKKRPKNEPNVKLAKSKFAVPTPSSSHNLNSQLSRTKSADTKRDSSYESGSKRVVTVRSPKR